MSHDERRLESRPSNISMYTPIRCHLVGKEKVSVELVDFHYRGACLKLIDLSQKNLVTESELQFTQGNQLLGKQTAYRITWETIDENGMFGVEFKPQTTLTSHRENRYATLPFNAPTVIARDPIDPNRLVYLSVVNISMSGLLLRTSFSNKHFLPGMELRGAVIEIPGFGKADVDIYLANARSSEDQKSLYIGAALKDASGNYRSIVNDYLSKLSVTVPEARISGLRESGYLAKNLSDHLTFKRITDQADYTQVLKLRFAGYQKVGKVAKDKTWSDMGQGLDQEGLLLGAYLGGQLVGSVEFRIEGQHTLTIADKVDLKSVAVLKDRKLAEMNRLVVHPCAQSTDIVVGLLRKIHAIAIYNGKPDGILLAEDKLVELYERIGAQKVGVSRPHPTKPNTHLHLMVIRRETYEEANGINPFAWSMVYSGTHEFLSHLGYVSPLKKTWIRQFQQWLTEKLVHFKKRKQSKYLESQNRKGFIDPKWTEPHLNASVLAPYILVADDLLGQERVNQILASVQFDRQYFKSQSQWVSIAFFDYFILKFEEAGGSVEALQIKAGYRNLSKDILGVNGFLLAHTVSPLYLFRLPEKWLPKFNKTRTWKVLAYGPQFVRFKLLVADPSLIPKNPSAKLNWEAIFDAYVRITTGGSAQIECLSSIFKGDEYCEYIIKWKNPLFSFKNITYLFFGSCVLLWTASSLISNYGLWQTALWTLMMVLSLVLFKTFSFRQRYLSAIQSLDEFQSEADERYRELQTSKKMVEVNYQEGKLLEKLNREIQQTEDLDSILSNALNAVCEQFAFKRSFIMILDEEQKTLKTAAVYGTESESEKESVWNFKVDVSKMRDNPFVVSSSYFSGQSVLISDAEKHKFQLNEISKKLIERLKVKSFAIVPIPGNSKSWGVMLADKGAEASDINRRDLVVLQRVSQIVGIALDKKSKLDYEIHLRKIFEKFVPSAVFQQINGKEQAKLGGETKELVCMFVDVRNFTHLSSTLAPQILVEKLNHIFKVLNEVVSVHGGMIDKYLGDGALVTWGAVPGSKADGEKAVLAAVEFCKAIEEVEAGSAKIQVGVGLHKGAAIAGTIGSNERMEFTVIGQAVNLAARLEQLTKVYQCQIVVSESLFAHIDESWTRHVDVSVRGVNELLQIATLNCSSAQTTSDQDHGKVHDLFKKNQKNKKGEVA